MLPSSLIIGQYYILSQLQYSYIDRKKNTLILIFLGSLRMVLRIIPQTTVQHPSNEINYIVFYWYYIVYLD